MRKKKERLFVEGYQDHESAVSKIAADLNLDPKRVDATIRSFFFKVTKHLRKFKNVYLLSFGLFNKTAKGLGQMIINESVIKKKRSVIYYTKTRAIRMAKRKALKEQEEGLDPWELNEIDAKRNPEKWKDRITLEK